MERLSIVRTLLKRLSSSESQSALVELGSDSTGLDALSSRCETDIGRKKELGTPSSDLKLLSSALASTGVNRRHFLRLLLATPVAASLDVEKLLWIPGQMVAIPEMTVGQIVASEWEKYVKDQKLDLFFSTDIQFLNPRALGIITNIDWSEDGN